MITRNGGELFFHCFMKAAALEKKCGRPMSALAAMRAEYYLRVSKRALKEKIFKKSNNCPK